MPNRRGTIQTNQLDPSMSIAGMEAKKTPKQRCQEQGGFWDEKTQSCLMVRPDEKKQDPTQAIDQVRSEVREAGGFVDSSGQFVPPTAPHKKIDFRQDGTVGYTTATGETFDLTRDEYNVLLGKGGMITENVKTIQALEGGALQRAERQQLAEGMGGIGITGEPVGQFGQPMGQVMSGPGFIEGMQAGPTPIDMRQAWLSAITDSAPAISGSIMAGAMTAFATGAKVGGKAGLIAGPKGAIALGLAAGTIAMAGVIFSNLKKNVASQKTGHISAQAEVLKQGRTNLRYYEALINLDPENAERYLEARDEQISKIHEAWRRMKIDTSTDLNLALAKDGTSNLAKFEQFFMAGGYKDILDQRIRVALDSPNPEAGMAMMTSLSQVGGMEE